MRSIAYSLIICAATAQTVEDRAREIWDLNFLAKRPPADSGSAPDSHKNFAYRPAPSGQRKPGMKETRDENREPAATPVVGITLWRMRRVESGESGVAPRLLLQPVPKARAAEYVPQRMRLDDPLRVGDMVRIAIESPRVGYLYIADRERFRDGTYGEPYLLFPVENLNGGDNRVNPGRLIEIPSQSDPIPALHVSRNDERQVGEQLLVLFSPDRVTSILPGKPNKPMPPEILKTWERDWSAITLRLDLAEEGSLWTDAEKAAGTDQRLLTQADPMPQSIFASAMPSGRPVLIHVPIEVQ